MVASAKGRSAMVRELLTHGADTNLEDNDSWSALLSAAKEGYVDIVLQLLEHNAAVDHRDMVRKIIIFVVFCLRKIMTNQNILPNVVVFTTLHLLLWFLLYWRLSRLNSLFLISGSWEQNFSRRI